jgi:hypothetical protein
MSLSDYIPEPMIILLGCQPWPPRPTGDGCPACGDGIRRGDDSHYCAVCQSVSPRREAQVKAARVGLKARDKGEQAEKRARDRLAKHPTVLSEADRRRLWNGYKGGIISEYTEELTNLAATGREWLLEIGQVPDWDLLIDKRGNVIGRYSQCVARPV